MDDQIEYATFICCISLGSIWPLAGSFEYEAVLEQIKALYKKKLNISVN